jgi:MFS transporter, Spinster family, sphingosine-1-phosphate transporter
MAKLGFFTISPVMLLVLFTSINILIYLDRGALAAVLSDLESHKNKGLGLSSLESGMLGSVFILGYMMASPIFAFFAQTVHPFYLMSIGLGMWCGAVFFTGISRNFVMLLIARALTGIGEASFVCLAPPCILDSARSDQRTKWIGIFYMATPLGYALGFIYGAQITLATGAWYYAFFIETLLMAPFILVALFCYKDPKYYAKKESGDTEKLTTMVWQLLRNGLFMLIVMGYTAYAFTIGGLGFWVRHIQGPYYVQNYYHVSSSVSTYALGGITVFSGIVGTASGSAALNFLMKKYDALRQKDSIKAETLELIRVEKATLIMPFGMLFGLTFAVGGTILSYFFGKPMDVIIFLIGTGIGEYLIFITIAPTAMSLMTCVPTHLRGQANAVSVFLMHALGDFPSPFIIGALFDTVGMFVGMIFTTGWLIIAVVFWSLAWNIAVRDM